MIRLTETFYALTLLILLGACSASSISKVERTQFSTSETTNQIEAFERIKAQPLTKFQPSASLAIQWWTRLDPNDLGIYTRQMAHHLSLAIVWKHLVVPLPTGTIHALDHQTGNALWSLQSDSEISYGVTVFGHIGYVGTIKGTVIAFDARLGKKLWETALSSSISAISAYASTVLVRSIDGKLYRLNAQTGAVIWTHTQRLPKLTLHGSSQPLLLNQKVLMANDSGELLTINASTGEVEYNLSVGRSRGYSDIENLVDVQATPLSVGDALYASAWGSTPFSYTFNAKFLNWQVPMFGYHPVRLNDDNQLLFLTSNGLLVGLNPKNGAIVWQKNHLINRTPGPLVKNADWWISADRFGVMHWFTQQGDLAARYKSQYAWSMNAVNHNNTLFFLNQSGELLAINISSISHD